MHSTNTSNNIITMYTWIRKKTLRKGTVILRQFQQLYADLDIRTVDHNNSKFMRCSLYSWQCNYCVWIVAHQRRAILQAVYRCRQSRQMVLTASFRQTVGPGAALTVTTVVTLVLHYWEHKTLHEAAAPHPLSVNFTLSKTQLAGNIPELSDQNYFQKKQNKTKLCKRNITGVDLK